MLLSTNRICARPVTLFIYLCIYLFSPTDGLITSSHDKFIQLTKQFDKYNDTLVTFQLQSPTGSVGNSSHFFNGISRQSEVLEAIRWFSFSGSARRVGCQRIHREKAKELKLAGNALNRPQNHTKDKETHKQNKVDNFY